MNTWKVKYNDRAGYVKEMDGICFKRTLVGNLPDAQFTITLLKEDPDLGVTMSVTRVKTGGKIRTGFDTMDYGEFEACLAACINYALKGSGDIDAAVVSELKDIWQADINK